MGVSILFAENTKKYVKIRKNIFQQKTNRSFLIKYPCFGLPGSVRIVREGPGTLFRAPMGGVDVRNDSFRAILFFAQ